MAVADRFLVSPPAGTGPGQRQSPASIHHPRCRTTFPACHCRNNNRLFCLRRAFGLLDGRADGPGGAAWRAIRDVGGRGKLVCFCAGREYLHYDLGQHQTRGQRYEGSRGSRPGCSGKAEVSRRYS